MKPIEIQLNNKHPISLYKAKFAGEFQEKKQNWQLDNVVSYKTKSPISSHTSILTQ